MIAVTGSTGFLGKKLLAELLKVNDVVVWGRKKPSCVANNNFVKLNINDRTIYPTSMKLVSQIIHCAARVHVMNDNSTNPLEEFREVNTYGTLNFARQAAAAGVKRFIFISSIKVNGESTELGKPFKPDDSFIPTDPYGLSKQEAEVGLRRIAKETEMEVVIIRPPLVYGPGVKANFAFMMKWVNIGLPLPLGGIKQNKRSLVSVYNLVDLIVTCVDHPNAGNQTFLVSDDEDISTTGLLENMAKALNAPKRLIPIPISWFGLVSKLIGKPAISQRLCGSLQVDISKTKEMLNWEPPYNCTESMKKTANAFIESHNLNKRSH
ncbi:UDP-glucose 4-epimerase [Shewanella sp. Choline-02u-19]|uniref:UDP-glucose 4-epimerase family protein n=1 Tax=unclassified Shewanella TaxID=196818 RepID=UPI000C33297D|nr:MULTISPECIES: SDR family oxidoreductase [unclassified Shewanella]PKH60648.1 UDP-glucose 4-epimerase [Shewanella sp. Bg11-22]PKI26923.1 UDP-glucose 4-epimerase [Shewanella sp. Choline-02u-19]